MEDGASAKVSTVIRHEAPDPSDVGRLVDHLSNADISWDGTLDGIVPTIIGGPAPQLLATGDDAIPPLITVLEDESKFVAAHVLLTLLSGVEYHIMPWNGLAIELLADGKTRIDSRQRFELARLWRAWQHAWPRPRLLPSD